MRHTTLQQSKLMAIIALLMLSVGVSLPAHAKKEHGKHQGQVRVQSSNDAAKIAQRQFGGKVLKVSKRDINGGPGYLVKLVNKDGRIMYVTINAVSGAIE